MEAFKALFRMFFALFTKVERVVENTGEVVVSTSKALDNYTEQLEFESYKSVVQAKKDLETHFGGRDQLRDELTDLKALKEMLGDI